MADRRKKPIVFGPCIVCRRVVRPGTGGFILSGLSRIICVHGARCRERFDAVMLEALARLEAGA